MCGSITISSSTTTKENHRIHAIAGFVCNNQGFLYDSNQRKIFTCKWWDVNDLHKVVKTEVASYYPQFRNNQINAIQYNFIIFSRDEFTRGIAPACRLRTRPIVYINKAALNSILNKATNVTNGLAMIKNLTNAGYKLNQKSTVYRDFHQKLVIKEEMLRAKTLAQRKAIYSRVWRSLPAANRKIIAQYRNAKPASITTVLGFNAVNKLKTMKARKEYLQSKKKNLSAENLKRLRNYIAAKNQAAREARKIKR